jgi:hypothetical protein
MSLMSLTGSLTCAAVFSNKCDHNEADKRREVKEAHCSSTASAWRRGHIDGYGGHVGPRAQVHFASNIERCAR